MKTKKTGIDAVVFMAQGFAGWRDPAETVERAPAPSNEPRIEERGNGWFLVWGAASGPVGAYGRAAAEAKLAAIIAGRC